MVIKISNLYIGNVYIVLGCKPEYPGIVGYIGSIRTNLIGLRLLYREKNKERWLDLLNGSLYKTIGSEIEHKNGDIVVDAKSIIPVTQLYQFDKVNYSKSKMKKLALKIENKENSRR